MVNYGLENRVALITGANNPQGIGAATAVAFAREGAKVVLVYKKIIRPFDESKTDRNGADRYFAANAGSADIVESRLREMNADYLILESDISDEDAVREIYRAVMEKYGRLDILVNNAADGDMDGIDTIEKITQAVIDDTFAVNVRGSILMIREFIKHHGDYGRIINFSTDASQVFAGQITYGASKTLLEALPPQHCSWYIRLHSNNIRNWILRPCDPLFRFVIFDHERQSYPSAPARRERSTTARRPVSRASDPDDL